MSPIKILHASDLHISEMEMIRSPKDTWHDLSNWDVSPTALRERREALRAIWESFRTGTVSASSYRTEILESFAAFVYINSKKFDPRGDVTGGCLDAVVLTGDLATTGKEEDIRLVDEFLNAPSTLTKDAYYSDKNADATLGALQIPVGFLPGNHDRFELTNEIAWSTPIKDIPRFFNPGGTNFDTLNDFRGSPVQMMKRLESPLPNDRVLTAYIFLADMTLREFDDHDDWGGGWIGQGKAHQEICDELVDQTLKVRRELPDNEVPAFIWACHFPPKFPWAKDNCRLVEDYVFLRAANRARIDAVLTGHTHRQLEYRRPFGRFDIFSCGTTTQYEPTTEPGGRHANNNRKGNFIQILTIDEDRGRIRIDADPFKYFHNAPSGPDDDPVSPGMGGNELPWKRIGRETVRYRRWKVWRELLGGRKKNGNFRQK
jgi:3',5'-cyclic AMP phosphodiesterase CpdA